jgi:hypothetical protein
VIRHLLLLLAIALVLWAVALAAGKLLPDGERLILPSAVAVAVCLVPTAATFAWGRWALRQSADRQFVMLFGGTGLRMAFVLGAGFALYSLVPSLHETVFWICLLVSYLVLLAAEMVLLLAWPSADAPVPDQQGGPPR